MPRCYQNGRVRRLITNPATSWLTTMASLTRRQRPRRPVPPRGDAAITGWASYVRKVPPKTEMLLAIGFHHDHSATRPVDVETTKLLSRGQCLHEPWNLCGVLG